MMLPSPLSTCIHTYVLNIVVVMAFAVAPTVNARASSSIATRPIHTASVRMTAPYDTSTNSLLWKLTAPNGAVSYIFGTMHLRDSSILRQRDTVLALLKQSRVMYAELDLDSMMTAIDPMVAMLPPGKTLESIYTPEELVIIRKALRSKLGEMAGMVEVMRPPMIVAMLMMDMLESNAPYGVDEFLWEFAKQANVSRRGIESPAEQLAVLNEMPDAVLIEVARTIDSSDTKAGALVQAYAREDMQEIVRSGEELSKWPDFERAMNSGRNSTMVDRLSKELVRGGVFIAVGALHLPGSQGMLRGFETRGFTVQPVLGGVRNSWMPPPPPTPATPRTGKPR